MNISSPETPKKQGKRRILAIGPPGGRKTTSIMSFPKVAFFDVDGNLDGPRFAIKKITGKEPTFGHVTIGVKADGSPLLIHQRYEHLVDEMTAFRNEQAQGKSDFQFACVDGLRNVGEDIKAFLMHAQKREAMETRDWDPYKTKMLKVVFHLAMEINAHVVFTCHEREVWETTGDKKEMMKLFLKGYEPMLQGGIQGGFSGFFTDVWRFSTELAPGNVSETQICSVKTAKSPDLKSSIGMPPIITIKQNELAWSKLEPFFTAL